MTKRIFMLLLVLALFIPCAGFGESTDTSSAEPSYAAIQDAVEVFLKAEMQKQAEEAEEGWLRFICEQGVGEITMNLEKFDISKGKALPVTFMAAGAQPKVKTQPAYEGEPETWLSGIVEAMKTLDVPVKTSLMITEQGGGYEVEFAAKAEAALVKSLKGVASKAKAAFTAKSILAALTDYLMPTPIAVPKKVPEAFDEADFRPVFTEYLSRNGLSLETAPYLTSLLYNLKGQKLDASQGPEAFKISYTAPDLSSLMETSANTLRLALAYDEKVKEYSEGDVSARMAKQVEKDSIAARHGKTKTEKLSYTFSLLDLPQKIDPQDFVTETFDSPADGYDSAMLNVRIALLLMPDYPAVPNPKTGLIAGTSSGTKCIFKTFDDGYHRCVSVYKTDTNELYSTIFIASGKTATVKIPKGNYYFIIGIGDVWYGEEHLFSDLGGYSKSEDIKIAGSNYYHTFTLNPKKSGNTELYRLNYDDLFDE